MCIIPGPPKACQSNSHEILTTGFGAAGAGNAVVRTMTCGAPEPLRGTAPRTAEVAMSDSLPARRSRDWFDTPELHGWLRTAALRSQGLSPEAIAGRPMIGICNTWSELTHCNAHLRTL